MTPSLRSAIPIKPMLTQPDNAPHQTAALSGAGALADEIALLAKTHAADEREMRIAIAQRLKRALAEGRKAAEVQLLKDRRIWSTLFRITSKR